MYSAITVDGADLYVAQSVSGLTPEIGVTSSPGLFSLPPVKDQTAPIANADGLLDLTTFYDARGISPQGWIKTDTWAAFYAAVNRLKYMLRLGVDHSVAWTLSDGTFRRALCRCISLEVTEGDVSPYAEWVASLRAADPVLYGATLRTVTFDPFAAGAQQGISFPLEFPIPFAAAGAGGNTVAFPNAGGARALPIYTLHGPWTNPWIENLTTGAVLYTRGLVLATHSDTLVIDLTKPELERVSVNGSNRLGWVDFSRSSWPVLTGGANLLRAGGLFASGADMSVQAEDAYL